MGKKQKLNLIEELTTHKCDFQNWPVQITQDRVDPRPRKEPLKKPPAPHIHIDHQSHAPCNPSVHIPFDLYTPPKPIVGTDPRACFGLKEVPRYGPTYEGVGLATILSPALPLNEVQDEEKLQIILNYTYSGVHKILMEEAALKTSQRPRTPIRVEMENTPIRFKPTIYPALPPGWITAAKHWDCLQSRNLGDPFKTFWTRKGPEVECSCCCNPLPDMLSKETKERIRKAVCENNLKVPYDKIMTGYGGYRQTCAKGVALERRNEEDKKI